ncbi:hypothetical protein [Paludibaculum fermentans]|uniref:hypothetical protein n=1 Tax=Paludibaculum fermentans TaxID=1473598 RepID=UPI003EC0B3A1
MSKLLVLLALSGLLSSAQTLPPSFSITTYAGAYSPGDGGPAVKALIHAPWGLTFDRQGNLYFCEWYQERIRRIDSEGTVHWAAGAPMTRTAPYNLSEGPADRVYLNYPQFLTTAPDGTIWFTTSGNIYRLNADGTITFVAGRGGGSTSSPDGTAARSATIVNPRAIAVDALGRPYFAEFGKNTVRRFSTEGLLETVAGTGASGSAGDGGAALSATFNDITDLEFDAAGNLYVCNWMSIRKIDSTGKISRFAGDPNASYGVIGSSALTTSVVPTLFKFAPDGQAYIVEPSRILKIDKAGKVSVAPAPVGAVSSPNDFAVDAQGNIYLSDSKEIGRITKITTDGKAEIAAGASFYNGDEIPAVEAYLAGPEAIAGDGKGGFTFVEAFNQRLRHVDAEGKIHTLAGASAPFVTTGVTAVDSAGNTLFCSGNLLFRISAEGKTTVIAGKSGSGSTAPKEGELAVEQPIRYVTSLAFDPQGRVVFGDSATIWRIETDGRIYRLAGTGVSGISTEKGLARELKLSNPRSFVYLGEVLYLLDSTRIKKMTADGVLEVVTGGGSDTSWWITGRLSPAATASIGASSITLTPEGVIYGVTSTEYAFRVRPDGFIERIGGDGAARLQGDGGPALLASFKAPAGITFDAQGNFYISDRNNNRIRKLTPLVAAVLNKRAGDEQSAIAGKAFELPLEVEAVAENGIGVAMVPLEVTMVEGDASLDKGSSTTGANGRLAIKVTAKDAGPLVIQVAAAGLAAVEFRLTVMPDVPPAPEAPVLAAHEQPAAPGMILILQGDKLSYTGKTIAAVEADLVEGRVPGSLGGLCIYFGETPAPVIAVSPKAVAVQVPPGLEPGLVAVRGVNSCGSETPLAGEAVEIQIVETAPEFFFATSGEQRMVVAHSGTEGRIRMYLTGLGLPEPAPAGGAMAAEPLPVKAPVYVWLQGRELTTEQIALAAWAPRADGWAPLVLPALFGEAVLLAPGLAVVEIVPPEDIGDEPWAVTVKAGEAMTADPAWVKRPPTP